MGHAGALMRWYHSLFLKIFLWFWCVIFLAMGAAVFTYEWIGNDYLRPATQREVALLVDQMEHERPVIAEGRRLWRSLRPKKRRTKEDYPHKTNQPAKTTQEREQK